MPRGQGRKPKPTRFKVIDGERHRDRLNENEPQPEITIPIIPVQLKKTMSKIAKQEWNRIAPQLESLGILSDIDMTALVAYCKAYAEYIDAENMLKEKGPLYKAGGETRTTRHADGSETTVRKGGSITTSPYMWIRNKALDQMRQFLLEFGMTPSSRSKVSAERKVNKDKGIGRFLTKGSGIK